MPASSPPSARSPDSAAERNFLRLGERLARAAAFAQHRRRMVVVRVLGYLLLLAGFVVMGRDGLAWHDTGKFDPVALGPLWLEVSRQSYIAAENDLAPWILYPLHRILPLWAAPSFLVLGLALVLIGRRRHRRRRR